MRRFFGLPAGISFFGGASSRPTLLKIAYAFEQVSRYRRMPRFQPTADLSALPKWPEGRDSRPSESTVKKKTTKTS